jgi:hypothetical protein
VRPQLQRYGHNEADGTFGDCHRTCIAMILDLDRDEVPHFMHGVPNTADAEAPESQAAERAEREWLLARSLAPVHWGYDGSTSLADVLAALERTVRGTAVILGCTSGNGFNHSVVVYNGYIYNPAGSNGTVAGPMRDGFWVVTAYAHATKPLEDPIERDDQPYIEPLPPAPPHGSVVTQEKH